MSLVFYDTETTGTETFFDQILQFAAIRTDADLNEIDRFEVRCRLLPHVVPAPGAMRVTGVRASQLTDASFPSHYEMVRAIRAKLLEWSPSMFIGWNSIDFDEDLIRQALYKTLHNPYLTNKPGNSRSDVLRIALACSVFCPDVLEFPLNAKGKKSFKLDQLAPANGFNHDKAHDAMGDVEATIHLSRIMAEKAPDIWSAFMRFSTNKAVAEYIAEERIFCLTDFFFMQPFSYMVTTIGQHEKNKNEWYVYDLSVHPESLASLDDEQLAARLDKSPKPLRRLKTNGAPMLCPSDDAPGICKGRELADDELERRAEMLHSDAAFRERIISVFQSLKEEYPPSPHVEKQIYDKFFERPDEYLMEQFHGAEWPRRLAIVEKLADPRLKKIGMHLIHLERPDLLDEEICLDHHLAAARRLMGEGEDIGWLTLPKALAEMQALLSAATDAELELLQEHDRYLRELHAKALTLTQ
jgi:exodeoxyribonuclease-1